MISTTGSPSDPVAFAQRERGRRFASAQPDPVSSPNGGLALRLRPVHVASRRAVRRGVQLALIAGGDVLAAIAASALLGAWPAWIHLSGGEMAAPMLVLAVLASLVAAGTYRLGTHGQLLLGVLRGSVLAAVVVTLGLTLAGRLAVVGAAGLAAAGLTVLLLVFLCVGAARLLTSIIGTMVWPGRRGMGAAVLVGTRDEYRAAVRAERRLAARDYRLVGWVPSSGRRPADALGTVAALPSICRELEVETVLLGGPMREARLEQLRRVCADAGCELLCPSDTMALGGERSRLVWRHARAYFELGPPVLSAHAQAVKRIVDLTCATAGIVLLAPLLALIAVAVRLDSPGPVLFAQQRAGLGGRCFRMLKFRTMRHGADAEKECFSHLNLTGDPRLFKIPDDPRVTRFGRFLRRWSLDELPQLWNVLLGDMSLVGPRPFFEHDFAVYEEHHFHRLGAKPGITGLWQVSGRSEIIDFEEVVRLDREYIESWSLALDLGILLRTVPAVLSRTGAY